MSTVIGKNIARVDGQEKVTGRALYTGDLKLPGMVHGKVLRCPYAHARIRRIDTRKAETLPGVVGVLTRNNLKLATPYIGAMIKDQPVIALEKARYAGDVVAAVAALDDAVAEEALKAIEVDYEELPAVMSVDDALSPTAPLIHERIERSRPPAYGRGASYIVHEHSNICHHFHYERGDVNEGFRQSDLVFEDEFVYPTAQHYPMEPTISVASFEGDSVTVWSPSQAPFSARQEISRVFGMPLSRIRVIVPHVGGGYGGAKGGLTAILAVALSRQVRRPVRVAFSADENFKTICQPQIKVVIKTGVKKDGTFVARQSRVYLNAGAYVYSTPSVTEKAGYRSHGPYHIPYVLTDSYAVYTNTVPAGAFRGFGGHQAAFAYESQADIIAHRLAMDPVELRRRNLLGRGEEYAAGDTPIDCDLKGMLEELAVAIEWDKKEEPPKDPRFKRGKGIACAVKDGGGSGKSASATVRIMSDGSAVLATGSVEIGQGVRTTMLQITAEELTLPTDRVEVAALDTHTTPFDHSTNASSATVVMGQAVQRAAQDARQQLLSAAASTFGVPVEEVQLSEGRIIVKEKGWSLPEIMRLCFATVGGEVVGRGSFNQTRDENVPLGQRSPFWEVGFGGAEVEVDEWTGSIRILKYVSVTDAGKMIHPVHCRGQDEGAAVFGIGLSLFEELLYEDGKLANPNLIDYRLPRFRDLPHSFTSRIREDGGGPGPYGAKGVGEGGILGVAPAVCNAVFNATGVRIRQVPLKGERVWRALGQPAVKTPVRQ
ncbi:MAG: xanthine dehydrogenase family protein molybdopterin-binding subunit [Deltaproteobacteria bacterium]|nr:xanthine dehydrogenase family protein molybdopterin-binding subunit [Deltaproteobacteria bacterium]